MHLGSTDVRRPVGPRHRMKVPTWAWGIAAAVLLITGLVVIWPNPVQRWLQTVFEVDQSAGPDRGINLNEVAESIDRIAGERVTVSGTVSEALGPRALVLGREGLHISTGSGDELLVVSQGQQVLVIGEAAFPALVREGKAVQVTGVIRRFDPERAARELGSDSPSRVDVASFEGDTMLLATAVGLAPETTLPGDKEDPESTDGPERGVTVNEILHGGRDYESQRVTVSAEVEEILSDHMLLLSDGKLLVVSRGFGPEMMEEATAVVTGTVRPFDLSALERELGIDLDDERLTEYAGKPVLVARSILMVR